MAFIKKLATLLFYQKKNILLWIPTGEKFTKLFLWNISKKTFPVIRVNASKYVLPHARVINNLCCFLAVRSRVNFCVNRKWFVCCQRSGANNVPWGVWLARFGRNPSNWRPGQQSRLGAEETTGHGYNDPTFGSLVFGNTVVAATLLLYVIASDPVRVETFFEHY